MTDLTPDMLTEEVRTERPEYFYVAQLHEELLELIEDAEGRCSPIPEEHIKPLHKLYVNRLTVAANRLADAIDVFLTIERLEATAPLPLKILKERLSHAAVNNSK